MATFVDMENARDKIILQVASDCSYHKDQGVLTVLEDLGLV